MKKMLSTRAASRRKPQKPVAKMVAMHQKTITGVSYTVRYPKPKKHMGYQPNETSQFAVPEMTLSILSGVGGGL